MGERNIPVLVVDDHEISRLGMKITLQKLGFGSVHEAASAEEALQLVETLQAKVVLMDIGLPGLNGIEAVRKLRETNQTVKVIMLTASDSKDVVLDSFAAGADAYCLKDITPDQLVAAIDAVMEGVAWLDKGVARFVLETLTSLSKNRPRIENTAGAPGLSPREMEVLRLLVDGRTNPEVAEQLCVSTETVKTHVRSLMNKLAVSDRTQVAVKAVRDGLI